MSAQVCPRRLFQHGYGCVSSPNNGYDLPRRRCRRQCDVRDAGRSAELNARLDRFKAPTRPGGDAKGVVMDGLSMLPGRRLLEEQCEMWNVRWNRVRGTAGQTTTTSGTVILVRYICGWWFAPMIAGHSGNQPRNDCCCVLPPASAVALMQRCVGRSNDTGTTPAGKTISGSLRGEFVAPAKSLRRTQHPNTYVLC